MATVCLLNYVTSARLHLRKRIATLARMLLHFSDVKLELLRTVKRNDPLNVVT